MKLTEKDKIFLETLKRLMETNDLWVQLKCGEPSYMVLRGTYGEKIHKAFRMTRQGVRWRFWRLFNEIYVAAFESILHLEKVFGTHLRDHAIRISKERYVLRQAGTRIGFCPATELVRSPDRAQQANDDKRRAPRRTPPGPK